MHSLQIVLLVALVAGCWIQQGSSLPTTKTRFTRVDKGISAENSLGSDESEIPAVQNQSTESGEDGVSQSEKVTSDTQGRLLGLSTRTVGGVVDSKASSENRLMAVGGEKSQTGVSVVSVERDERQSKDESTHEHHRHHHATSSESGETSSDSHESKMEETSNLNDLKINKLGQRDVYTENPSLKNSLNPTSEQAEQNSYPQITESSEEDDDTDPSEVEQKIRLMQARINDIVKKLMIRRFIARYILPPNPNHGRIYLERYYFTNPASNRNFHDSGELYWRNPSAAHYMSELPYDNTFASRSPRSMRRNYPYIMKVPSGTVMNSLGKI